MLLLVFLTISSLEGSLCSHTPYVSCLIVNLEYTNCTWQRMSHQLNYTFHSKFGKNPFSECPLYLTGNRHIAGCRLPYITASRFHMFDTKLSWDNSTINQTHDLRDIVKLNPPVNVSVMKLSEGPGLWLYWNVSKSPCTESVVRYRANSSPWKESSPNQMTNFNVPLPSEYSSYTFQVKVRVSSPCGMSRFWSDWSLPVTWHPAQTKKDTKPNNEVTTVKILVYIIISAVVLFSLVILIFLAPCKSLIPAVPNPGKNLQDLLHTFNGDVEEWLYSSISKELVAGFKPNFSESACTVREAPPKAAVRPSTCSFPFLRNQSECFSTSRSCTSTSTLLYPLENTPPGMV